MCPGTTRCPRWTTSWYTVEQDTVLTGEPEGEGPVVDVWTSAECLRKILDRSH
jgi:hypothetical protein